MKNLILCAVPGDEISLFGNAVTAHNNAEWHAVLACSDPVREQSYAESAKAWRDACRRLNLKIVGELNLAAMPVERYDWFEISQALKPLIHGYDRVYIPDVDDPILFRRIISFSAARHLDTVWMAADGGPATESHLLNDADYFRLVEVAGEFHGPRLSARKLQARDIRGVRQYRRLNGADVLRFAHQWLALTTADLMDENPWDVETSRYDQERYVLELEVIRSLQWESLAELGACLGTFTERLVKEFPERSITAYEPNERFEGLLRSRLGDRVTVVQGSVRQMDRAFDLVFASSVLYYFKRFPSQLLDVARKYLVTSHSRDFHEEFIVPVLSAAGWKNVRTEELFPKIELFSSIPMAKEGNRITAWERP